MNDDISWPTLAVILAAGLGTRMRSLLPKVMHLVGNRPLLGHVLAAVEAADIDQCAVVLGAGNRAVADYLKQVAPSTRAFIQHEQLGTAHALFAARAALQSHEQGCVLVLFGDSPLISPQTLLQLRQALIDGAAVAVAGFHTESPGPYGRLLVEEGCLLAIREAKDASPQELEVGFCNGGVMGLRADTCLWLLERIGNQNAQGEYYLTDAVAVANSVGLQVTAVEVAEDDVLGVNDREQLHAAEQLFQQRRRLAFMQSGVSLMAADTVFFSADTQLAKDVCIEPCVVFGPGVSVGSGVRVDAFRRLENIRLEQPQNEGVCYG
ncbi:MULTISPECIES: NTP transferase domain-containing protein [Pseudomonas]|uniref:NTP transferase domain-containing protein n=2 Tax=Pseudomonas TaxID=286 RepID=A0ABY3PYC4_9PSED|nr:MULTISPECIES: NTP transferase domain-containing protein [Pseudomonas]QYY80479.1 NTP transferase domain-containing protein [Pseudomonas germanica]UFP98687.1 NTP transferase domain-containing protein [Pseudomonas fitomaticsae]